MSLSLLIYLAYLSGAASIVFTTAAIMCILGAIIGMIAWCDEADPDVAAKILSFVRNMAVGVAMFGLMALIIPTQKTVYLMIAAEIGEDALTTPEAAKLRELLNEKLDEALAENEE